MRTSDEDKYDEDKYDKLKSKYNKSIGELEELKEESVKESENYDRIKKELEELKEEMKERDEEEPDYTDKKIRGNFNQIPKHILLGLSKYKTTAPLDYQILLLILLKEFDNNFTVGEYQPLSNSYLAKVLDADIRGVIRSIDRLVSSEIILKERLSNSHEWIRYSVRGNTFNHLCLNEDYFEKYKDLEAIKEESYNRREKIQEKKKKKKGKNKKGRKEEERDIRLNDVISSAPSRKKRRK